MRKVIPNPDRKMYDKMTEAVASNDGYCPCMLVRSDDTKCMCRAFREQTKPGLCHCGRFLLESTNS